MNEYPVHTVVRLSIGDERIATGRILRNKCILQVKPNTYKIYLTLADWIQGVCLTQTPSISFEEPSERKRRLAKTPYDPAMYISEPRDIHTVRIIYDRLELENTLSLKDKPRMKDPHIYVQIGDILCPLYFHRTTSSVIVRYQDGSINKIRSFHELQGAYNEVFFYKTGEGHVLKRILP